MITQSKAFTTSAGHTFLDEPAAIMQELLGIVQPLTPATPALTAIVLEGLATHLDVALPLLLRYHRLTYLQKGSRHD